MADEPDRILTTESLRRVRLPHSMVDMVYKSVMRRQSAIAAIVLSLLIPFFGYPLLAEEPYTAVPTDIPDQTVDSVPAEADPPAVEAEDEPNPSIMLRGSVWRTKAGIVFLKTPVGTLTLSSKTTLKDLKASQEVTFLVHERSSVVEIRKRSDGSLVHRYLSGPMMPGPDSSKTLRWWTADGEQAVHIGTQEAKLASYKEGDPLTIEVNESQAILGVHDLQFDLQISQVPPSDSQAHLLLSGPISKLKSKFVFFRTDVGVVMVNSKIGLPRVKVGQYMTLRIDNGHVDVELGKPSKPAQQKDSTTSSSAAAAS